MGDGECATILGAVANGRDDAQRAAEDRLKRAGTDIDGLQKAVVPRGETDERWAGQRAHNAAIQPQLNELSGRNDALYGPGNELARLNREIDDLRGRPPSLMTTPTTQHLPNAPPALTGRRAFRVSA